MNEILLSNEVIVYLLAESLLYFLLCVALVVTLGILQKWNFNHFTSTQFKLENRAYLVTTILLFSIVLKMVLLPYFVYTIDRLSDLIPGAMCGAGVIKANVYGNPLLILKIVLLFLSGLWLSINRLDLQAKEYPYLKLKLWFFVALFILLSIEFLLDILYFTQIETSNPVSCCSVIFGQTGGANGLPFGLDIPKLLGLFYLLFILLVLALSSSNSILVLFSSMGFSVIAYYTIVYFFGTYIYELPTHQCPFCMLQEHYYYVGYLIWGLLFTGLFFAINNAFIALWFQKPSKKLSNMALLLLTFFVLLCSSYVVIYYFKNGAWL